MKEFFKKYKWIIIIVITLIIFLVGRYLYMRRELRFSDNGQATGLNTPANGGDGKDIGGNLGFVLNSGHSFKVGDTVIITQDQGATYPQYDGETKVKMLIGDRIVITEKGFLGNTPPEGGTIRLK